MGASARTPYRLHFDGSPVDYIIINFDFDSAASGTRAIPPVCCQQFDESLVFSRAYIEPFGSPVFLGKALGYHPYYLNARFRENTGVTLHGYIEQVRLGHAKRLLIESTDPIRDIAQGCGFFDPAYFSKFFLRHTGMLPKDYRDFSH